MLLWAVLHAWLADGFYHGGSLPVAISKFSNNLFSRYLDINDYLFIKSFYYPYFGTNQTNTLGRFDRKKNYLEFDFK